MGTSQRVGLYQEVVSFLLDPSLSWACLSFHVRTLKGLPNDALRRL